MPFIANSISFLVLGEVMQSAVFSKACTLQAKLRWFFSVGRAAVALHPILAGIVLGIF